MTEPRSRNAVCLILCTALALLPACASNLLRYGPPEAEHLDAPDFASEAPFFRSDSAKPELCIAISGGGMRSASFSIGALSGLHEAGVLDEVDAISATSGGAWALSWYVAQQVQQRLIAGDPAIERMLAEDGAFRKHLIENGRLIADSAGDLPAESWQFYYWGLWSIVTSIALAPFNLFFDFLLNFDYNENLNRSVYSRGLTRTYHHVPDEERDGFGQPPAPWSTFAERDSRPWAFPWSRDFGGGWVLSRGPQLPLLQFSKLHDYRAALELPLIIVTATPHLSEDTVSSDSRVGDLVFEMTQRHFGSDAFGFHSWDTMPDQIISSLNGSISVAGAAVDSAAPSLPWYAGLFIDVLNQNLGWYVPNPNTTRTERLEALIPFPFYWIWPGGVPTPESRNIYLTDGGHLENLALYPLLRRGCGRIIAIDATSDRGYGYSAAKFLQRELPADLGLAWEPPSGNPKLSVRLTDVTDGSSGDLVSRITYVKSSLDPDAMDQLPEAVRVYAADHADFPHQPTTDQNYSRRQVRAYVTLGHEIVRRSIASFEAAWAGIVEGAELSSLPPAD